jgi:hypothetical protein
LQVIFRQQIQPWHPSSTLVHEAGAAVLKVAPEKFWQFSEALFKKQTEFFDLSVLTESRNDTYKRLAAIASSVGVDGEKIYDLLALEPRDDGALNGGNGVTDDIKLMIKVTLPNSNRLRPYSDIFTGSTGYRCPCFPHGLL